MGIFDFGFNFSKGGGTNIANSTALMDHQSKLWKENTEWFNKNGYSFLREGLINADYNPLLAIGAQPLNGEMPNATATDGTTAVGVNWHGAAASQASTAKKISDSQINLNQANALKAVEEGLTQSNIRTNYDADTALKQATSNRIWTLLPYEIKEKIAQAVALRSQAQLNNVTAQYVPYNAESGRISSNAQQTNAEFNKEWTPKQLGYTLGAGLLGLTPFGVGKLKSMFKRPVGFR